MIALLFALGAACFALSLPIAGTQFGAKLRQTAGVWFVLALLPSLVVGLPPSVPSTGAAPTDAPPFGAQLIHGLSCFGVLVLLSLGAYGVLRARKRFRKPKKEPWEFLFSRGGGGKKRVPPDEDDDLLDDLGAW